MITGFFYSGRNTEPSAQAENRKVNNKVGVAGWLGLLRNSGNAEWIKCALVRKKDQGGDVDGAVS